MFFASFGCSLTGLTDSHFFLRNSASPVRVVTHTLYKRKPNYIIAISAARSPPDLICCRSAEVDLTRRLISRNFAPDVPRLVKPGG